MSTSPGTMRPTRISATFKSEWTKLWTLRATRRSMLAAIIIGIAVAALFTLTLEPTTGVALADTPLLNVVTASLLGADAAALMLMVMSAGTIGSEYANGMIRTTLTATPKRSRFLLAKAGVIALATFLTSTIAAFAAFGVGQFVLMSAELPGASVADPSMLRLILGSALMAPLYSLAAIAFSIVIRSTAGGIVAALVLLFLPTLTSWLPEWWHGNVLPYLPGEALHSLSGLTTPDKIYYSQPAVAAVCLVVWVLAMLAIAQSTLAKRDA